MIRITVAVFAMMAPAVRAQTRLPVDSLQPLAERSDARLAPLVRQVPDSARAAWVRLISLAARAPSADADARLAAARRLAIAYAGAWRDSFFVRQTVKIAAWSPSARRTKATVDSLRIAGGSVLGAAGATAALAVWRESARLAHSIGDSAGEGSALGNIAVAFYRDGALDSAEAYLVMSSTIAERIGDRRARLNALGTLATVAKDRHDLAHARALYERTLALRDGIGDDRGAASDENNLGLVAQELGDTAGARRRFQAALERNRRAGRTSIASDNLTNLANLATLRGDYVGAARMYREAISIRHAAGERAREAPVLHNLGLLEARRGDYPAARTALASAIAIYDSTGPRDAGIAARKDLAQALGAMGEFQDALAVLTIADSVARRTASVATRGAVARARADLALAFNALSAAERDYAAADSLFTAAGDAGAAVDADQGLASVLLRRGDVARARDILERVRAARVAAHDREAEATTLVLLGYARAEAKDTVGARTALESAHDAFASIGHVVGAATALGELAEIELRAGRSRHAETLYARALSTLGRAVAPETKRSLRTGHARALIADRRLAEGAAELRRAVADAERVAGTIRVGERRTGFRDDKWTTFAELSLVEHALGRDESAFAVSERLRGREMLELLDAGRVQTPSAANSTLVSREQDLRRRISALERSLENTPGANEVRGLVLAPHATDASTAALSAAQKEYADLLTEIQDAAPAYGQVIRPATADMKTVSARLRPNDALIEYLVADSTTIAFVVRHDHMQVVDLGISRHELATAIAFTREAIDDSTAGSATPIWRAPLRRLYHVLVEPLERSGALQGARVLLIAPHAELHYLPFAALIGGGGEETFLVERYDIAYVPSASLWIRLGERNSAALSSGVLALAPRPDALPASRGEVNAIQAIHGAAATTLIGADATAAAFRERAPRAAIVHVATFGVLNAHNPLFSFVELAPGDGDDGHLAVHDVFGIDLHARLVVLSACQTALGSGATADVPAGDDWVGLVRAFLYAGADNVLATLWPVRDRSAAQLMGDFYESLTTRALPGALAAAQRAAIHDPRTASPTHWAAFTLTGAAR